MDAIAWEELGITPVEIPSSCQTLLDEATRLDAQRARLIEQRRKLLESLGLSWPLPAGVPVPPEIKALNTEIAKVETAIKTKREDFQVCMQVVRDTLCPRLNTLARGLKNALLFYQKEIRRLVHFEDPRPKAEIMKDIRRVQAATKWIGLLMWLLGCVSRRPA